MSVKSANQFIFEAQSSRIQVQRIVEFLRTNLEDEVVTIENAILSAVTVCDNEFEYGLETGGETSSPAGIAFIAAITRMIRVLIDAGGSDIDAVNAFGQTALSIAVQNDMEEIATMLITAGCDVNRQNSDGESPLHIAAQRENVLLTRLLLSAGADASLSTQYLNTAMYYACRNVDVLQTFIDAGVNIKKSCMNGGAMPLHCAALFSNSNTVELLLRHGALIDGTNDRGRTALMFVASQFQHPHLENLRLSTLAALIVAGASIDAVDNDGCTALHLVCCPEVLRDLVAVGGNVDASNLQNKRVVESIFQRPISMRPRVTMLKILFTAGAVFSSDFRSNLVRSGSEWRAIFDNPAPFVEQWQQRFAFARKDFSIRIFRAIRPRAFMICCALQTLHLPALLTLAILDAYFEPIHGSYHLVSMYTKWSLVTKIKHKT